MSRLNKFLRLPFSEKILLVRIWVLLAVTRSGLSLLPFTALRKVLTVISPLIARGGEAWSEDLLVWAVGAASRYVPGATCLAQALAIQLVLKQSGRPASLHIGVNGIERDHLDAHAWVVSQGRVLFGGSNLGSYTHLLALE
jgi:Transglutaminase-like superfamily